MAEEGEEKYIAPKVLPAGHYRDQPIKQQLMHKFNFPFLKLAQEFMKTYHYEEYDTHTSTVDAVQDGDKFIFYRKQDNFGTN